ncbi:MAG TPA: hypothetical protein VFO03_02145 [Gaiellaceae bacterium]|nr:hypothetical protein [Gaiellaceae bacterium]
MGLRGRRRSGRGRAAGGRAGLVAVVVALFLAAGLVSTWPALKDARSDFLAEGLRGRPGAAAPGDHLQVAWQLWLPGHQLRRGAKPWLDPYSFQPEADPRVNFAGWPFAAVFGPLKALFGTVVAWNLFVLLGYLGAGGLAFLWLRSLGLGAGASLVGGLAFALAPYRAVQAGAGHLAAWIAMLLPLSLWAWERRWYWLSAVALVSIPLSGQVHLALGAIPFVLAYALLRGGDRRWAGIAAAGAAGAGLLVWATSIRGSIGSSRSFDSVERYSAELADLVSRHERHGLEPFVFLGWLVPLLALLGLVLERRTRLGILLGVGAVVPALLALGANLPGYEALWNEVPGLGVTRVPGRLMPISCLSIAALAAFGTQWALRWRPGLVAVAAALALVAVDLRAGVTAYRPTAADAGNRAYAALRREPAGRLLEMPVYRPGRQEGSVYLYYAMQAPRERPAGYSTVAPKAADRELRELRPCADARHLAELGVRLLAVYGRPRCGVGGRLVARDGAVALYEAYIPVGW